MTTSRVWRTNWIKAVLSLAGVCASIVLLDTADDIVSAVAHRIATATPETKLASETSNSFWAVIDTPVRSYLAQHTSGLATGRVAGIGSTFDDTSVLVIRVL
ncbi:hypothetical protein ACFV9D_35210 [Streptomyces sp. NPDC059875]|uniref:hypothetical protein n=1 Tax=unclassified Streptomyces TaxID=2593676 RepID=UPI003657DFAB